MADTASIVDRAYAFAQKRFGDNLSCVFVAGSHLTGMAGPESDVDMVVLCKSLPNSYWAMETEEGLLFDLKVHDWETLEFELKNEHENVYSSLTLNLLSHSQVMPADNKSGVYFQNKARTLLAQGPKVAPQALTFLHHRLSNVMRDFSRTTNTPAVDAILSGEAMILAMQALALHNGQYTYAGQWVSRVLGQAQPEWHDRLMDSHLVFGRTGDKQPFLAVLKDFQIHLGAHDQDGFRFDFPAGRRIKMQMPPLNLKGVA